LDRLLGLTHDIFDMPKLKYKERLANVKVKGGKKSAGDAKKGKGKDDRPSSKGGSRPGTGKKGSKKKGKGEEKAAEGDEPPKRVIKETIELKTLVAPQLVTEWINYELYMHMRELEDKDLPVSAAPWDEVKTSKDPILLAGPSLKNWNIYEVDRWGLEGYIHKEEEVRKEEKGKSPEENAGKEELMKWFMKTRVKLFLTDSTVVHNITKDDFKRPVIWASFRMELNGLHTYEWFCHAKLYLDKHEELRRVSVRFIKHWRNGKPHPLPTKNKKDYQDWEDAVEAPDNAESNVMPRE